MGHKQFFFFFFSLFPPMEWAIWLAHCKYFWNMGHFPTLKPFTPNTPISFPHSFAELTSFCGTGSICGGLQMFFKLQKERNNVWGFYFLWVIDCLLTSLLPSWEVWGALALVENGDKPMYACLPFLHNEVLSFVPSFIWQNDFGNRNFMQPMRRLSLHKGV